MPDGAVDVLSDLGLISRGSRLPDQVSIDFGPPELLGPAFLQLDRAAREQGVYLSISHDLAGLAAVNEKNRKDWYPLAPMFDPRFGGVGAENSFWISGTDEHGDVVVTQAARLYVWPDTSFADEWESLNFIYPDPQSQAQPGERCTANCDAATKLTGRVCHTGGLWLRPDIRQQGLVSILPRVTRAYALTRWYPEFMFGIAKKRRSLNPQTVTRLYGWRHMDSSLSWYNSPPGLLGGVDDLAVLWMDEKEVLQDTAQFTALAQEPVRALEHAA